MSGQVLQFGEVERQAAERLVELALAEDLGETGDITCKALVERTAWARGLIVARRDGVVAGGPVARRVFERLDPEVRWEERVPDGFRVSRGTAIACVSGGLAALLTGERTALNFLMHLSGVATLTRKYVDAVAGTKARIFDTRKTLPGYRVLEKYAVRAGGGMNHRMGLYDGLLIKDNHLAAWGAGGKSIAEAVAEARRKTGRRVPVEVEVDTLEQLREALGGGPDIVLLDNMDPGTLREAVAVRDALAPEVSLEASGGVTLETVRAIAKTGVERISVGAITHSAGAVDIGLDWEG